jgi:hypothetical protein
VAYDRRSRANFRTLDSSCRSHAYVDHYKEKAGQAGRPWSADGDSGSPSRRERLAIGKVRCLSALHFRKLCACPRKRSSVESDVGVSFCHAGAGLRGHAFSEAYCRRPGPTADMHSGLTRLIGRWTRMVHPRRYRCLRSAWDGCGRSVNRSLARLPRRQSARSLITMATRGLR